MRYGTKLTFISDNGRQVVFNTGLSSPYWLNAADGIDGLDANLYTVKGAGQDGETDVAANLAMRSITVSGKIRENPQYSRAALLSAVLPGATGKLVYELGGVTRYIKCRVKRSPIFSAARNPEFQIAFQCANPFWRKGSGEKQVVDVAQWIGALTFPVEIPEAGAELEYRSPSLVVNIPNAGDVPVGMMMEFRAVGATSNPSLINVNTQEQMALTIDMLAGDVIRVWTGYGEKRAERERGGVTTNVFNDIDGDSVFLQLAVGDNLLRYNASVIDNLEVSIYYDVAFVGV